jgi:hypothetical protein
MEYLARKKANFCYLYLFNWSSGSLPAYVHGRPSGGPLLSNSLSASPICGTLPPTLVVYVVKPTSTVNEENKSLLLADPGKYVPHYGGYCAKTASRGKRHVQPDPGSWKIVDGKLYLFRDKSNMSGWYIYDPRVVRAAKRWEKTKVDLLGQ